MILHPLNNFFPILTGLLETQNWRREGKSLIHFAEVKRHRICLDNAKPSFWYMVWKKVSFSYLPKQPRKHFHVEWLQDHFWNWPAWKCWMNASILACMFTWEDIWRTQQYEITCLFYILGVLGALWVRLFVCRGFITQTV